MTYRDTFIQLLLVSFSKFEARARRHHTNTAGVGLGWGSDPIRMFHDENVMTVRIAFHSPSKFLFGLAKVTYIDERIGYLSDADMLSGSMEVVV
jgi:hypothetical protein